MRDFSEDTRNVSCFPGVLWDTNFLTPYATPLFPCHSISEGSAWLLAHFFYYQVGSEAHLFSIFTSLIISRFWYCSPQKIPGDGGTGAKLESSTQRPLWGSCNGTFTASPQLPSHESYLFIFIFSIYSIIRAHYAGSPFIPQATLLKTFFQMAFEIN